MVECTPLIDIGQLLGPVMMSSTLKGGELDITPLVDVMIGQKVTESLLSSVTLPSDFADLGDVICLQIQLQQVKALEAIMKGETYEFDLSKVIDMIVTFNLMSAITNAFG